jgi:hypothetical protein
MLARRYAFLGWITWKLAKRQLRRSLGTTSGRGPVIRSVTAVAVLAMLAGLWLRRGRHDGGVTQEPSA